MGLQGRRGIPESLDEPLEEQQMTSWSLTGQDNDVDGDRYKTLGRSRGEENMDFLAALLS